MPHHWLSFATLFFLSALLCCCQETELNTQGQSLVPPHKPHRQDLISLGSWETIGPFRIGTREAVWGADPLQAFHHPGHHHTYFSPLAPNATVRWQQREFNSSFDGHTAAVQLSLSFDNVDWHFIHSIYGWAALQFQAWARSEIVYHGPRPVNILFYPTAVLEFTWNGQRVFGGDFFAFERAPVLLKLLPGQNTIALRLIREVRAHGGWGSPSADASIRLVLVPEQDVVLVPGSLTLPDVINGRLASDLASLVVCNTGPEPVEIVRVLTRHGQTLDLLHQEVLIAPGQSRPLGFSFPPATLSLAVSSIILKYRVVGSVVQNELIIPAEFTHRSLFSSHKLTFAHPSGSVSYALIRPPPPAFWRQTGYDLPIMLNLHGAGVDVDGSQTRHSFDAAADLPCWMLFPTGMSPWSSDDWHTWGLLDIYAALEAVRKWQSVHWAGPGIIDRPLVLTGHSNGGQGAWHFASHHPDHVYAAVVASGYTSIQNYVPYSMWTEADPFQNAVIERALGSFKNELFLDNLQNIPILVQHGSDDDNVPVYHARLMTTLAAQRPLSLNLTLTELPGKGHWFDGIMTTPSLLDFYTETCTADVRVQPPPANFSYHVALSDDGSSKYGLVVDQLHSPDRLGKISVTSATRNDGSLLWQLQTTNIRRLHFDEEQKDLWPDAARLDRWPDIIHLNDPSVGSSTSFVSFANGTWAKEPRPGPSLTQRTGLQRGALEAILRTRGPFQLLYSKESETAFEMAVQVSRNLLQYFGADSNIQPGDQRETAKAASGNLISILQGARSPSPGLDGFPIRADHHGVWIRNRAAELILIPADETMGAVWLQPLPDERLELVIWAADTDALHHATRMVPTLTGVGQPDFVVFGKDAAWKGHAGTLAMGFLDYNWDISAGSFLP